MTSNANAVLTYTLSDNAGGRFAIDAATGVLTVADGAQLNFEGAQAHSITVLVTDQSELSFDKTFTINVTDVNEAPTDEVLTGRTVAENVANGTVVGTVTGVDPDANAVLTYTLSDNAGGRFAIDATTGVLTVADTANSTSKLRHRMTSPCGLPTKAGCRSIKPLPSMSPTRTTHRRTKCLLVVRWLKIRRMERLSARSQALTLTPTPY